MAKKDRTTSNFNSSRIIAPPVVAPFRSNADADAFMQSYAHSGGKSARCRLMLGGNSN